MGGCAKVREARAPAVRAGGKALIGARLLAPLCSGCIANAAIRPFKPERPMSNTAPDSTPFDSATIKSLQAEIAAALTAVAQRHGLSITPKSTSWLRNTRAATMTLEIGAVKDGLVVTKESEDFKRLAPRYGLQPDDLGREFVCTEQRYRIIGLSTRSRNNPIHAQRIGNGKTYSFPAPIVKLLLANAS